MNNEEIKKDIVDTISDKKVLAKKVKLKINYKYRWQRILASIYLLPRTETKNVMLSHPYPGTVFRLLGIILDLKGNKSFQDVEIYAMIKHNIPLFVEFLATAFHNAETDPPKWLYRAINYGFSSQEIYDNVVEVYRRLDVQTFFGTSESLIDLQKLNPILEGEPPGQ